VIGGGSTEEDKTELDVATAGVTNVTEFFALRLNFHTFHRNTFAGN